MGVNPQIACRKIFSLTKIIKKNSFVCEFNKGRKMDYLDDMRLKKEILKLQQIVRIYTLFGVIYELFKKSKVDIRELVRVYTHYVKKWRSYGRN